MIEVVDGVRDGAAGGRGLKCSASVESITGKTLEIGLMFSWVGFVPARRGGGSGGGFDDVVDDEFEGEGYVYCDVSSEIEVDLLDSLVEDLDLACP